MTVSDQLQRDKALDITNSFIVQAPAGSGKTGVLTLRILKLLALVEEPEEILAITFTKKAAAEMRVRVMEALELAAGPPPENPYELQFYTLGNQVLAKDREHNWGLKQNQNRLRLLTIDSFCSGIVKNRPLASGLGVQFSIAEDPTELYTEAARELLASLDAGDELGKALRRVLGNLDNHFTKLSNLVIQMLAQRDHWLADVSAVHGNMDQFRALLEHSLANLNQDGLELVQAHFDPDFFPELEQICIYAKNQLRAQNLTHPLLDTVEGEFEHTKEQLKLLLTGQLQPRSRFTKNEGFPTGDNAAEKKLAKEYKARVKQLVEQLERSGEPGIASVQEFVNLPHASLSPEQWQLLDDVLQIMRYAAAHLKLVFQSQRSVDFNEVALSALMTLGTGDMPSDVTLLLDNKISHILVDEFQDTSFVQVELLDRLTSGWEQNDGRTLFLVGDPMQSIYAFRKADVGLFLRLWRSQRLGSINLIPLTLTSNFRSSATVIDWVNRVFKRIFPAAANTRTGAVQYSASVASKDAKPADAVSVTLFGHEKNQRASADVQEAHWICEQIKDLPRQESVAILVKGKSHVGHIVPHLKNAGIPYQAVDIESLSQSQIISDLLAAARALLSPNDKVSWFALLRGPWLGLTLKELDTLNNLDSVPWNALQKLEDCPWENDLTVSKLKHIRAVYQNAYLNRHRSEWQHALRSIVLQLGIPASARNKADLQSIDLFFGLLDTIDTIADIPDFQALRKKLDDLFVPPEIHPVGTRVVQVMTMHKSKGLEFDSVFLPQLHRKPRADDKPLILLDKQTAQVAEQQELFLAPFELRHEKNDSTVYAYLWRLQRQRLRNEAARLLYVACTRAKQRLLLSACVEQDDGDLKAPDGQSLLAFLIPRISDLLYQRIDVEPQTETPAYRCFRSATSAFLDAVQTGCGPAVAAQPEPHDTPTIEQVESGSQIRRHAGTLTHAILEAMAKRPSLYGTLDPVQLADTWAQELSRMGLETPDIPQALDIVTRAVTQIQRSQHGAWLFQAPKSHDAAEFSIMRNQTDKPIEKFIVDRTFVENGTRYIIDYKLSEPENDLTEFLQQQVGQYRSQLLGYHSALNAEHPLPTKLFLYFPLIDHLEEVAI
ncbi:MAG TPA: hypothetical protein DCL78_03770 [Gammaproteobacteria bacterium]|nr:hypothetical protein [Pseudomonadales bacterium]MEC8810021.1 UvrD-helicase domain-containing protein [Pseudomonadota bacterium]HAG93213.1 hypothetical protein [Gammaproteobacteria bacterium]HCB40188.1 hypothetical protein [Gammaproteobacteria bacterium]